MAPGAPGANAIWTPADNEGFGTSTTTASRVWYTLEHGRLTEVYYPNLGTPSIRDLQVVIARPVRAPRALDRRRAAGRAAVGRRVSLRAEPRVKRNVMDTAELGPFTVSRICLGAMFFGTKTPAEESHRMLDRFRDAGGNFVDTADVYGDGESERTLAPWLARHRDEVVLATKVRMRVSDPPGEGLAPERIRAACDASLKRLGVDAIDLYQVHAPDPDVPLEESLEALDGLVQAGKVRALGASNFPAWLLAWAVAMQDREGWAPFLSLQPQYSLVERSIEVEILPFCRAAGIGVIPWGPLGAGFLTGKYARDSEPPPGSRMAEAGDEIEEARHRRAVGRNFRVVDEARAIAEAKGATIPQVALAWMLGVDGIVAPIVGPRTFEQLEDLLGAVDVTLDDDERARLERHAAPPEMYPQRMLHEQVGLPRITPPLRRERATAAAGGEG